MNRNLFRTCTIAGALAVIAACSDTPTSAPTPQMAPSIPSYDQNGPFNNDGACMHTDATRAPTGTVSGVKLGDKDTTALNCTANDVSIATAELQFYAIADPITGQFGTPIRYNPGDQVSCPEGRQIQLTMAAKLNENATSERYDIGVWLATDGGNGKVGACKHFNLLPGVGVTAEDSDVCGDLKSAAVVNDFELGTFDTECRVNPNPPANATPEQLNSLHVGSCLGWTEPGANRVCPTSAGGFDGYRFGTLPGNKSKCNCDGFDVPIVIAKTAKLEVVKACSPTTDPGTFDLLIDNSTSVGSTVVGDNKACGGSTGAQILSAGTNTAPGAVHSFGEGDFTTANYTSAYSCVNRTTSSGPQHVFTASGDAAATGTSLGPNQITLKPGEDVVCTYTNTRNGGKLELVKALSPSADPGKFNLFIKSGATTVASATDVGDGGTTGAGGTALSIGTYALSETAGTGTTLTNYTVTGPTCKNRSDNTAVTVSGTGTVDLASNADVVCTITNTRIPTVNSIIAPTQTTCEQYAGGNRILEPSMQAGLKGRVINNVSPGVIFFYSTVTVTTNNSVLKVIQSNTPADNTSPFPAIAVASGQAYVYTYNSSTLQCTRVATFTNLTGDPTVTLNTGTYIVQIKYNPNSLVGYTIATPVNAKFPVVYGWGDQLNGAAVNNIATNNLTKK
jgi:hypothetical protein